VKSKTDMRKDNFITNPKREADFTVDPAAQGAQKQKKPAIARAMTGFI
jgi:hypothetical protein